MATSIKGENVYQCDTCYRKQRVSANKQGLDVLPNCNITLGCLGKMRRLTVMREIINTPAFPPELPGVQDWFQRKTLYTHTQQIADNEWIITHNLAAKPVIHAYVNKIVDGGTQLVTQEPQQITTVDPNTTKLTFSTPYSGLAQCITLTSQNTVNYDATVPATATQTTTQITSTDGEITIATLDSNPVVNVTFTYITPAGNVAIDYVGVDNVVSINSPWVNAQQAIINGKKYTLRSFNLTTTALAPAYFNSGAIPNQTGFYVSAINGQPLTPGRVLLVWGKAPFTFVDRVTDKYVDPFYVDQTSPQLVYANNAAFAGPAVIKTTYPQILVVS